MECRRDRLFYVIKKVILWKDFSLITCIYLNIIIIKLLELYSFINFLKYFIVKKLLPFKGLYFTKTAYIHFSRIETL